MTDDPVRLLDEGGSELLCTLLSAAREEQPASAALERTLTAVGVGAALSAATTSASAGGMTGALGAATAGTTKGVAGTTFVVVVKWLSIGLVAGTAASSAVYGVSAVLAPPPRREPATAPVTFAAGVATEPSASEIEPRIPAPSAIVTPPAAPAAPVPSPAPTDSGLPLAAEVAALDSARQALRAGDAGRALELLSDYETRFPEARMMPEALYLELESFVLNGDQSNAQAVAQRMLRVYPSSPHAARARVVLGLDK